MANRRNDRHKALLDNLSETGTGSINELCRRFGVSEMTIRRDLSELEREALLIRTHGGAKLMETAFFEISFAAKTTQFVKEKKRIAECAAAMVRDGERIIIDSGTTTGHFARCLKERRITVVTNALNVATARPRLAGLKSPGRGRGCRLPLFGRGAVHDRAGRQCHRRGLHDMTRRPGPDA